MAETVDTVLVRLDGLRDRPIMATAVMMLLGITVAVAWWFGRPDPPVALQERIPMAGTEVHPDPTVSVDEAVSDHGGETGGDGRGTGTGSDAGGSGSRDGSGANDLETAPRSVVAHVSGEVLKQGLVHLENGARIADAVDAAGGPTPAADVHRLNLAAAVADGMHIRVPAQGADPSALLIETDTGSATSGSSPPPAGGDGSTQPSEVVDINRAGASELETLPGIGPALAEAIIRWRTDNGGFAAVDDLVLVPGIGPAKLAALRDLVTV